MRRKIMLIDDDPAILEVLDLHLKNDGYDTLLCDNSQEALGLAGSSRPDLIILDVVMPGIDGWELCRRLRQETQAPIIFLTAKGEDIDKCLGLGLGGDDYLTKPFSTPELLARIRALLRRVYLTPTAGEQRDRLSCGALTIDRIARQAWWKHQPLDLTVKEFNLLVFLAEHRRQVLTREQIYERVWGEQPMGEIDTLTVHMMRLRQKLAEAGAPSCISTMRGVGYKLEL